MLATEHAPSFETSFSHTHYNKLLPVEEAFSQVTTTNNLDAFLTEIVDLASKHEVSDLVGIRLCHKHWFVAEDHIMHEKPATRQGKSAFVTKATPKDTIATPIAPTCWLYADDSYHESEYSSYEEVVNAYQLLKTKPAFFQEFLEIAKKFNYEHLLVPAILGTEVSNIDEKSVLVERNINQESIVTLENAVENASYISTTWSLKPNIVARCITVCDRKSDGSNEKVAHNESWW